MHRGCVKDCDASVAMAADFLPALFLKGCALFALKKVKSAVATWQTAAAKSEAVGDLVMLVKLRRCIQDPAQSVALARLDFGVSSFSDVHDHASGALDMNNKARGEEAPPKTIVSVKTAPKANPLPAGPQQAGGTPTGAALAVHDDGNSKVPTKGTQNPAVPIQEGLGLTRGKLRKAAALVEGGSGVVELDEAVALGNFYVNQGLHNQALPVFKEVLAVIPDCVAALLGLGR